MATTSYVDTACSAELIGSRTTSAGAAATDVTAEEFRLINSILAEGYLTANAFKVNATTGMNLTVGSGAAKSDVYAVAGEIAGQGTYLVRLEGATAAVTVPAADASARTDEIYLIVADGAYDSGSVSLPRIGYRKGTAGGGAPGVDTAWKASVKLATIAVGGSVSSITSGNITDNRTSSALLLLTSAADPRYLGATAKAADSELLDGIDSTGFTLAPGAWHTVGGGGEPAFGTDWANAGGGRQVLQFRKHGNLVHLRGDVSKSGAGTTIVTLPSGYRPPAPLLVPNGSSSTTPYYAAFEVLATGEVNWVGSAAAAPVGLCCSFWID